jgi:peptidoglycan hydrolase-like protein with peptidoglycan-binding domain
VGATSKVGASACALALALTACSSKGDKVATVKKPPSTTEPSTTTTTVEVTSTTVTPTTRPKVAPKAPAGLGPGSRGPSVLALERRLDELRYDVGKVDGVFDSTTGHGVMAFQKIHGMNRTGRATDGVIARLANATTPGSLVGGGGATRIEVDIKRQVLLL